MLLLALVVGLLAAASGGAATTPTPPIVFAADQLPKVSFDVYRLDANGTVVDLSKSAFRDDTPVVSPDGRHVAFVSNREGTAGIYEVGIDGKGLRRLDPPPHQIAGSASVPELAWSPDSRALAAVSGILQERLTILAPGRTPVVAARAQLVSQPIWSPGGRFVAVQAGYDEEAGRQVRVYTRAGKLAWQARYGDVLGWSRHGLLATALVNHSSARVKVYDERGKRRYQFRGRTAAWSPDGQRLASVERGVVEVRTPAGHVFLRKPFPGLAKQRALLRWIDDRRLLVSFYTHLDGLDTATGKTFAASSRWLSDPRSPDGRLLAETARAGSGFAVEVSRLPDGKPRVYGQVPGCRDDGVFEPAIGSLQFVPHRASLVYESMCAEPFSALYAVNPDGSALTRLTQRRDQEVDPSWSPDGLHLAYTHFDATGLSCKGCPGSLRVADANGSNARLLATPQDPAYSDENASWSPDGTQILFTQEYFSKEPELFVVPAAGGTPRDLRVSGGEATWGPSRIAWLNFGSGHPAVWTARPDGSDRTKVEDVPRNVDLASPAWSRDGRLAFVEGTHTAVISAPAGITRVQLPFLHVSSLRWSPDGTRFVVAARARGTAVPDVYTVRVDGSGLRRLTRNLDVTSASWR